MFDQCLKLDIARWKVNFSSARNWGEGSILPVVPFRFDQFKSDSPSICQFYSPTKLSLSLSLSVSVSVSLSLSLNVGIICPNNTFCYIYNCLLLITPPPWSVPIAMSLTFLIRLLSKRFSLPTFLKTKFSPPVLHLFFHLFTEVLINFGYFKEKFLMADDVPNFNASSQLPTSLLTFWGISFLYFFGLPCDLLISFTAKLNSAFVISFVVEETTFLTVISSAFSVFSPFYEKNSEETTFFISLIEVHQRWNNMSQRT